MTGLEALSMGRPVVATPSAGIDVLEHGANGLLIEPGRWEPIAEALRWYYDNPDELYRHSFAAPAAVADCGIASFGERYARLVKERLCPNEKQ